MPGHRASSGHPTPLLARGGTAGGVEMTGLVRDEHEDQGEGGG